MSHPLAMQPKKRTALAVGAGVVVLIGGLLAYDAATKDDLKELSPSEPASLTLRSSDRSAELRPGFQGISLETRDIMRESFDQGNLVTLLRNLGPATLRIGGDNADEVFWTSRNEPAPSWSAGVVGPASVDRLANVAKASGWSVTYTVNFRRFDPPRAAEHAAYVSRALGPALQAIEIGNEPDAYYTDSARYLQDYNAYVDAIRQRVPNVRFAGNDAAKAIGPFQDAFIAYAKNSGNVNMYTQHGYPQTACGSNPTMQSLLALRTYEAEKGLFSTIAANARNAGAPGSINETNSVACEGTKGVSDTHGAAVWSVSHTMAANAAGLQQANYHGSTARCDAKTPEHKHYTPFCATDDSGKLKAQPLYYGMLLTRQMGTGTFVGMDNPAVAKIHAFAVQEGSTTRIALANVQDPLAAGPTEVTIRLDRPFTRSNLLKLETTSGKGLSATDSITVGDAKLQSDGKVWSPQRISVPVQNGSVVVRMPAGSAAVLTLTP